MKSLAYSCLPLTARFLEAHTILFTWVCLEQRSLPELEADGLWRAQCQVWVTGAERQGQPQPDETLLFLSGCSSLRKPRIRQPEMELGVGAASEAALLLRGWKRSRDSRGRSRPASKQPGRETPRWINNPDIWWDPGIAAIREVLAPALTLPGFPL